MDTYDLEAVQHTVFSDDADVVLYSDPKHLYYVSSGVLSSASRVFRAMFGPNFAEGQALLRSTPDSLPKFELCDDSTQALRWLFSILHDAQQECLSSLSDPSCLQQLAVVADKYDCAAAVRSSTSPLLASMTMKADAHLKFDSDDFEAALESDELHNTDLIEAAWLLDDAEHFQKYTNTILREGRNYDGYRFGAQAGRVMMLPSRVEDHDEDCKSYLFEEIAQLVGFISAFLVRCHGMSEDDNETWEDCKDKCDFQQRIASRYLEVIVQEEIHRRNRRSLKALSTLIETIEGLRKPDLSGLRPCEQTEICHAS